MSSDVPDPDERVELTKPAGEQRAEEPFDPYRFGAPDVPPPPEYAPPGYVPPAGHQPPPPADNGYGAYPPYPYGTTNSGTPGGQQGGAPYGSPYGPPPGGYGQYPYQYGPQHAQFQPSQGNGRAVAGLVLGIVSIVMFWTTFIDGIFVILALVFGILGLNDARNRGGRGRGQAIAGLVCAGVGVVLAIAFTVFVLHLSNQCGGLDNQGGDTYNQCIRDKI